MSEFTVFFWLGIFFFLSQFLLSYIISVLLAIVIITFLFSSCQFNILLLEIMLYLWECFPYSLTFSFSFVSGFAISVSIFWLVAITSFPSWELASFFSVSATCWSIWECSSHCFVSMICIFFPYSVIFKENSSYSNWCCSMSFYITEKRVPDWVWREMPVYLWFIEILKARDIYFSCHCMVEKKKTT